MYGNMIFGRPLRVTVRPVLWDHCLFCLSVTLVYCGQMAGWIKMPLGTQVGLSPLDIVLGGTQLPHRKGHSSPPPHFSAHVYCGNEAGWIRMLFGTEVGLGPGGIVLDGHPTVPSPTFWPMSIVAKWSPVSATAEHLLVNVCGHCCFQFLFH